MEVKKSLNNEEVKTPGQVQDIRKKKTIIGANVIIMILISIAIFVFASYINDRNYYRFDFTASGKYTLSSKTKNTKKPRSTGFYNLTTGT
ncbi:MAG: ABC transporter related protein [Candidatus Scalindua rubra]|uniref:ABC transporter related protein n=1 Tax=Candidatus Scalindua rubra TaxID=1872076 RepID=A0A1E3X9T3_9BACT|nr:MAG: ABC transporter related protein [Candidatus Scalindua rubra]